MMPSLPEILHAAAYRLHWRFLLCLLLVVVSEAALSPAQEAPSLGFSDKADHLMAFVSLGLAAALSLRATRQRAAIAAGALLAYGAFIELVQTQVPGRHAEWADLGTDAIGIALGLLLAYGMRRRWQKQSA
jgi:VanZ family protein